MSPEQLNSRSGRDKGYLGTAVDVWASGVWLTVMLVRCLTPARQPAGVSTGHSPLMQAAHPHTACNISAQHWLPARCLQWVCLLIRYNQGPCTGKRAPLRDRKARCVLLSDDLGATTNLRLCRSACFRSITRSTWIRTRRRRTWRCGCSRSRPASRSCHTSRNRSPRRHVLLPTFSHWRCDNGPLGSVRAAGHTWLGFCMQHGECLSRRAAILCAFWCCHWTYSCSN